MNKQNGFVGVLMTCVLLVLVTGVVYGWIATKEWRYEIQGKSMLAQAVNEKQVAVEQAKAELESAKLKALADIERARGIAESNEIINNSLTDRYIRWLYVENIKDTENQVIYLPTEAGLPILESSRLNNQTVTTE